mgnify:CR=1 FL=1
MWDFERAFGGLRAYGQTSIFDAAADTAALEKSLAELKASLEGTGTLLGIDAETRYPPGADIPLAPGDLVVWCDADLEGVRSDDAGPGDAVVVATMGHYDEEALAALLARLADEGYRLILSTGGTGLTPTDRTPAATRRVIDREIPGMAEQMRAKPGGDRIQVTIGETSRRKVAGGGDATPEMVAHARARLGLEEPGRRVEDVRHLLIRQDLVRDGLLGLVRVLRIGAVGG